MTSRNTVGIPRSCPIYVNWLCWFLSRPFDTPCVPMPTTPRTFGADNYTVVGSVGSYHCLAPDTNEHIFPVEVHNDLFNILINLTGHTTQLATTVVVTTISASFARTSSCCLATNFNP